MPRCITPTPIPKKHAEVTRTQTQKMPMHQVSSFSRPVSLFLCMVSEPYSNVIPSTARQLSRNSSQSPHTETRPRFVGLLRKGYGYAGNEWSFISRRWVLHPCSAVPHEYVCSHVTPYVLINPAIDHLLICCSDSCSCYGHRQGDGIIWRGVQFRCIILILPSNPLSPSRPIYKQRGVAISSSSDA